MTHFLVSFPFFELFDFKRLRHLLVFDYMIKKFFEIKLTSFVIKYALFEMLNSSLDEILLFLPLLASNNELDVSNFMVILTSFLFVNYEFISIMFNHVHSSSKLE